MLKILKRWLGWDADSSLFDFSDLRDQPPANSTRARGTSTPVTHPPKPHAGHASAPAKAAPRPEKQRERNPLDLLDNPKLTLDKPPDDGFDPYNTGAFNRSASWDKIGRQRKR
jgi:hypothetical protein